MMQTTTVLTSGGAAIPMQSAAIVPSYVVNRPIPKIVTNYANKTSCVLGVLQISIGLLCIVFNVITIAEQSPGAVIGDGIWGGLFFILTGAYGLVAGCYKTMRTIIVFMVLSIMAASTTALCLLVKSIVSFTPPGHHRKDPEWVAILQLLLIGLALVEVLIAAWSAALGCSSVCCGRQSQYGVVMQPVPVMMDASGTQVMYMAGPPSTYPQRGNMGQQQGLAAAVTARATSQPPVVCSQYGGASGPPPYLPAMPSGAEAGAEAAAESSATTLLVESEEKKVAL